jgi:hypothetical protein
LGLAAMKAMAAELRLPMKVYGPEQYDGKGVCAATNALLQRL